MKSLLTIILIMVTLVPATGYSAQEPTVKLGALYNLTRALPVVAEQLREAEIQLTAYREALKRTEGESLKLRTHAVVSIGLERLVW